MTISEETHQKIMKEGKEVFEMFEEYDKTQKWPAKLVKKSRKVKQNKA